MKKQEKYELENRLVQDLIYEFVTLRHELGLTQKELAEKSNVLRTKITKIESGLVVPSLTSLIDILGPLGYTMHIGKIEKKGAINE